MPCVTMKLNYWPKTQVVFAAKPGLRQKTVSQATLYPTRTTTSCSQMPYHAVWEGPHSHKLQELVVFTLVFITLSVSLVCWNSQGEIQFCSERPVE